MKAEVNALRKTRCSWLSLVFAVIAGGSSCAGPNQRPPRSSARASSAVHVGDTVTIRITDDAWLSTSVQVDRSGAVDVPGCGSLAAVGFTPEELAERIAVCFVRTGAHAERLEVLVTVRRVGRVLVLVGADRMRRRIPFEPGLTVTRAVAIVVAGSPPREIVLQRKSIPYKMDLRSILNGEEPDEPLESGDEIGIEADVALRGAELVDKGGSTMQVVARQQPEAGLENANCGDLWLESVALGVLKMGPAHPRAIYVADALRERCSKDTMIPTLLGACRRVRDERATALGQYGSEHPRMRVLDAQIAFCTRPE